jgi:organic hydroperoxide reductase OsmC/OhrA
MSQYLATIHWQRGDAAFVDNRYSRAHVWRFDGVEVPASSSPQVVPLPLSSAAAVDPEEAFVAALASCHMLWFLSFAAARGLCVDRYDDAAIGVMAKNAEGRMAMTEVTLRPRVDFAAGTQPTRQTLTELHDRAHEACFIAASVLTRVSCEPVHHG